MLCQPVPLTGTDGMEEQRLQNFGLKIKDLLANLFGQNSETRVSPGSL